MKITGYLKDVTFIIAISLFATLKTFAQGPNAPEASGFEPVGATDMVNLSSGDMSYVLPLLEVDGFPVTLSYHAGIPMDMEASWVGLGWNINTGAIARGVVANPDDWGIGRRLNLTYLYGEIESYSVNVGVGIAKAAEVGVGLSWGSNKSISGSVSASIGPASASIDTNGNYNVGIGTSGWGGGIFDKISDVAGDKDKSPFGGSLSISGNTKKGGIAVGVGVGGSNDSMSMSMGVSVSGQGVGSSFSVGGGNNESGSKSAGGGAGISMNSFSAGDFSYNTKGFYVPIQIGIFSFGFGYNRTEVELSNAYDKFAYGMLYHDLNSLYSNSNYVDLPSNLNNSLFDYQRRDTYGDVYEQSLPQSEEEFIGDYRSQIEKLNFTFGGYDSYSINASGLGGALKPIVGQNTVLIGEGYDGGSIRLGNDKTKVFYHNSKGYLKPTKKLSYTDTSPNKLNFSFDGQITEDAIVSGSSFINYNSGVLNMKNFINEGTTLPSRPRSGSYVETYTNAQIDMGADIMIPASLKTNTSSLSRESQGYIMNGIGGYKVTTPDGKTYHFSQPVYHYEQIQHSFLNFDGIINANIYNSNSKREATPYATHWLLTAIVGPDYVDTNNNNFADENDYGYWLRLDYGQWSNAYVWRTPFDDREYHLGGDISTQAKREYSTYVDNEVEKSDPGYFLQGRKDLYYLDKIVSKNQTAVFVKDLRYDAFGTSADYKFNKGGFNDKITNQSINTIEHAVYDREYQLKLDKIIIINKKESEISIDKTAGNGIASIQNSISLDNRYSPGGFFDMNLGHINNKIHRQHLNKNIIDVNDLQSFDYSKASKVIKLIHSYDLAKKSPSSGYVNDDNYPDYSIPNPYFGRLTLERIKTYGRGIVPNANENQLYDFMPPYVFDYNLKEVISERNELQAVPSDPNSSFYKWFKSLYPNKDVPPQYKYVRAAKDNWGFINKKIGPDNNNDGEPDINAVDAWSLNKITTPQGATIEIEYEEDDFYIEAFGRRYWENNLKIAFEFDSNPNLVQIHISSQNGISNPPNFLNYFDKNEKIYLDLALCRYRREQNCVGNNYHYYGKIDIDVEDEVLIHSVQEDLIILLANRNTIIDSQELMNRFFDKNGQGSHVYESKPRGACPDTPNGGLCRNNDGDHHTMKYKLLSNKIAPGTSGGGLRVRDITVRDEIGSKFLTRYDYSDPFKGRSSGITSFNPIRGEVFVPYQNELPGPGVMYEWVTMKAIEVDVNNVEKEVDSIRYHYYTLNPYFPIFNPNIDMLDLDGESIFKTTVTEETMSFADLTAKDMHIEKNLTKIGQLISIEEFNQAGHLMSKTHNTYQPRFGELSETFSSMKSVFDFNEDSNGDEIASSYQLQQHYLSLSTKSEKVSVLKSVDNFTSAGKSTVTYSEPDYYLGTYTASTKSLSDGTLVKEKKFPAYKWYSNMGSKLEDVYNKNMLTQEAMSVRSIGNQTINSTITTWNNQWFYRDQLGNESIPANEFPVWRKHKSFIWKDDINPVTGTYGSTIDENHTYFDWSNGMPTSNKWQNVSEITRYNHWSSPIESRDINNNFASSKLADNSNKVIASGNARYSELYYSGAEYVASGNIFEGEVKGANYRTNDVAHSGEYSVKNNNANDKVFVVSGETSSNHDDLTEDFRPGKYKVSFWSHDQKNVDAAAVKLNGTSTPVVETVEAGCWKQFNYYVDLQTNSNFEVSVTNTSGGGFYFDDFRMHPVYASMNSFVYDLNTDELLYVLDGNNMGSAYRYDNVGRLKASYQEVENTDIFDGGFKIMAQYNQHYQNITANNAAYNEDINNCISQTFDPLKLKELAQSCIPQYNPYDIQYAMYVYGGSGSYKYEWQYLTDVDSGQYTNWYQGTSFELIPYANRYCDENTFDKYWGVKAKVTDLVTGESVTSHSEYNTNGCPGYIINPRLMLGVEGSQCHDNCGDSKYKFHLYPLDADLPLPNSTGYTDNNSANSYNIDLIKEDGLFCPVIKYVKSSFCSSGYIQHVSITPRHTGSVNYTYDFYLDCVSNYDLKQNSNLIVGNAPDPKYASPGMMVLKIDGKIVSVIDTNKK